MAFYRRLFWQFLSAEWLTDKWVSLRHDWCPNRCKKFTNLFRTHAVRQDRICSGKSILQHWRMAGCRTWGTCTLLPCYCCSWRNKLPETDIAPVCSALEKADGISTITTLKFLCMYPSEWPSLTGAHFHFAVTHLHTLGSGVQRHTCFEIKSKRFCWRRHSPLTSVYKIASVAKYAQTSLMVCLSLTQKPASRKHMESENSQNVTSKRRKTPHSSANRKI